MRDPPDAEASPSLLCGVGQRLCAIPIAHVIETMRPLAVEAVAGAPEIVRGLAIVRGTPTPVLDASLLFGGEGGERRSRAGKTPYFETCELAQARFVTLRTGGAAGESRHRVVALLVDAVLGVRSLPHASVHELPALLRDGAHIIAKVGELDAKLLFVLQTLRLIPEDLWKSLEESQHLRRPN